MTLDHILDVSRAAKRMGANFPGYLSTGEALTAALVLNRPDYLERMDYTIAEALDRIDSSTIPLLRKAERVLKAEA